MLFRSDLPGRLPFAVRTGFFLTTEIMTEDLKGALTSRVPETLEVSVKNQISSLAYLDKCECHSPPAMIIKPKAIRFQHLSLQAVTQAHGSKVKGIISFTFYKCFHTSSITVMFIRMLSLYVQAMSQSLTSTILCQGKCSYES